MRLHYRLNKSSNKNILFDYYDFEIGFNSSNNNFYFSIIIFGFGFDYDTFINGFRIVNQHKEV